LVDDAGFDGLGGRFLAERGRFTATGRGGRLAFEALAAKLSVALFERNQQFFATKPRLTGKDFRQQRFERCSALGFLIRRAGALLVKGPAHVRGSVHIPNVQVDV